MLMRRRHGNDAAAPCVSLATRRRPMASRQLATDEVDWPDECRPLKDGEGSVTCCIVAH